MHNERIESVLHLTLLQGQNPLFVVLTHQTHKQKDIDCQSLAFITFHKVNIHQQKKKTLEIKFTPHLC